MKHRKLWILIFSALCLLWLTPAQCVSAEAETTETVVPFTETVPESQSSSQWSRTGRILGFLGIFTVTCGVTAGCIVIPKVKKLKSTEK